VHYLENFQASDLWIDETALYDQVRIIPSCLSMPPCEIAWMLRSLASVFMHSIVLEGEVLTIVHCESTHICWLNIVSSLQTLFSSSDWFTTHLPVQHKTRWTRPAANAIMDAKDADQTFIMGLLLFWEWFCSKFVWLYPLPCPSWQQQDTLQLRRERSL